MRNDNTVYEGLDIQKEAIIAVYALDLNEILDVGEIRATVAVYNRTHDGKFGLLEEKVIRKILGIIAGAALCNFGFMALGIGLAQLWSEFAVHVRTYREQHLFTLTPLMAVSALLLWFVAAFAAGFVAMKIARDWRAVKVLAALVVAYAVAIHLILEWATFPWWYNIAVVLLFGPAILLGARIARIPVGRFAT